MVFDGCSECRNRNLPMTGTNYVTHPCVGCIRCALFIDERQKKRKVDNYNGRLQSNAYGGG